VATKGNGITAQELMEAQEQEGNMQLMDNLLAATAEAMNALESAIYRLRDELSGRLATFIAEADKEKLGAKLTAMEDWLYDEGFDCEKAVYEAKLKEITDMFAGGDMRCKESEMRPDALAELSKAIDTYAAFAASSDEAYAHIAAEEKQKAGAEVAATQAWLSETKATLDALSPTDDPKIKAADISAKAAALVKVCKPIMDTPKPLPKEPEPAPAPAADAAAADSTPAEGAEAPPTEGEGAASAEAGAKPDNMDVD